jgi:hypothetical protein
MSKNLDRYSIIDAISKFNQDLASEINKMNFYEIQHPNSKNSSKDITSPLMGVYDDNDKYFNDKFKSMISLIVDL